MADFIVTLKYASIWRTVRLALILSLLCVPVMAQSLEWQWQTDSLGTLGEFTYLAMDSTNSLHMIFIGNGKLIYAFRPAGGSKWSQMPLGTATSYTAVTVDSSNKPHVCYTTYDTLRYTHWNGKDWSGQEIAPKSGQIAYTCSIAIAADGTPNISWYQLSSGGTTSFFHLRHAALKEGRWQARTVDYAMETGKWNSLQLDSDGNPHLSYSAHALGEQRYAKWDGKTWAISTIEARTKSATNAQHPGYGNSLALAQDGSPLVSYMDEGRLKFARKKPDSGWSIEEIDSISPSTWEYYRSSLRLDANGFPHIAYHSFGALKHAYWDGKEWRHQIVATTGGRQAATFPSMVISKENIIYIAYVDADTGAVSVAVGRPSASAGSAEAPTDNSSGLSKAVEHK